MTARRDTPLSKVFQPSSLIDEAWHLNISCTRDYREFCKKVFGAFLDHVPGDGTGGFGLHEYQNTLSAYEKRFGELRPTHSGSGLLRVAIWSSYHVMSEVLHPSDSGCTCNNQGSGCRSCG